MQNSNPELQSKIYALIAEVFRISEDQLEIDTEIKNIPNFDSLELLNLFLKVEQELNVNFPMEEMLAMTTIGDLVQGVEQRQ